MGVYASFRNVNNGKFQLSSLKSDESVFLKSLD